MIYLYTNSWDIIKIIRYAATNTLLALEMPSITMQDLM